MRFCFQLFRTNKMEFFQLWLVVFSPISRLSKIVTSLKVQATRQHMFNSRFCVRLRCKAIGNTAVCCLGNNAFIANRQIARQIDRQTDG